MRCGSGFDRVVGRDLSAWVITQGHVALEVEGGSGFAMRGSGLVICTQRYVHHNCKMAMQPAVVYGEHTPPSDTRPQGTASASSGKRIWTVANDSQRPTF